MKEKKKLSLPAWIFIGMIAGIIAGLIFAFAGLGDFTTEWIKPIGTIYVNLLKFLVVPVVLFSIADGVISLKDLKRVGSVGVKTFVYYMCTTALAVVIGLVLVNLFKGSFTPLPSADLGALEYEAKEAPSVMQVIVNIFPSNLLQPMVSSDMLPVIVTAIFLGAGVLAAGEKGKRYALPHSRIMIHQPLGGAEGQASDVEIRARQLLLIKRQMNELMAGFTGRSYDELVRDTDRDNFMSAQEALEYGLIDRVLTSRADL